MKPGFDQIQLNRQVVLVLKERTESFSHADNELSGTILTINRIEQEEESIAIHHDSDTIIQHQKKKEIWVLRDDIGEIFLIPYQDIESVQYIFNTGAI
jgi:hypothetical protein